MDSTFLAFLKHHRCVILVADPFLSIRRMELYFVINSHLKVQTSQVFNLDLTALSNEVTYVAAVVVPFAPCCKTCVYSER
jgi:hypothetical protein